MTRHLDKQLYGSRNENQERGIIKSTIKVIWGLIVLLYFYLRQTRELEWQCIWRGRFRGRKTSVQVPLLTQIACMTLSKSFDFSQLQPALLGSQSVERTPTYTGSTSLSWLREFFIFEFLRKNEIMDPVPIPLYIQMRK